mgnify:FL=1
MDRCALAYQYHKQGWNCAQSVAGACADLAGRTPEELLPLMGGFGGGIGGSHEEICGAVSGGALILSLCFPFSQQGDLDAKKNIYRITREYRRRFFDIFGHTRCADLLQARPGVTEKNPASRRLVVTAHCDNMIVTAVELLEQLVEEERNNAVLSEKSEFS